jgi:hypothetical protein
MAVTQMQTVGQQISAKDEKVSKIIDRVLTQIFGREATNVIYKHLERRYSVKRDEISENLELFAEGLEDFLKSGAYIIENKILEDVWLTYGLVHKSQLDRPRNGASFVIEMKLLLKEA